VAVGRMGTGVAVGLAVGRGAAVIAAGAGAVGTGVAVDAGPGASATRVTRRAVTVRGPQDEAASAERAANNREIPSLARRALLMAGSSYGFGQMDPPRGHVAQLGRPSGGPPHQDAVGLPAVSQAEEE